MISGSEMDGGHRHMHVPDDRIPDPAEEFEYAFTEVYSTLTKSFPIFGKVIGAKWHMGAGGAAEEDDYYFSEYLAHQLNQDRAILDALVASRIGQLMVYMGHGGWTVCHPLALAQRPEHTAVYEAVARRLPQVLIPSIDELRAAIERGLPPA